MSFLFTISLIRSGAWTHLAAALRILVRFFIGYPSFTAGRWRLSVWDGSPELGLYRRFVGHGWCLSFFLRERGIDGVMDGVLGGCKGAYRMFHLLLGVFLLSSDLDSSELGGDLRIDSGMIEATVMEEERNTGADSHCPYHTNRLNHKPHPHITLRHHQQYETRKRRREKNFGKYIMWIRPSTSFKANIPRVVLRQNTLISPTAESLVVASDWLLFILYARHRSGVLIAAR
jgi:hypothetical protein